MEVFAAGNVYRPLQMLKVDYNWYIYGYKLIKSKGEFRNVVGQYNVGPIKPEQIKVEE